MAVLLAAAAPAHAEDAVVVLDRGAGSASTAERDATLAARLVEALRARDVRTRLVVFGTRPNGRTRAAELRGAPERALEEALTREGFGFEGGTDPRVALEIAIRRVGTVGSLSVFLVGAFAGDPAEAEEDGEGRQALEQWSEKAPETSRIFALGASAKRTLLLKDAKGAVVDGAVVVEAGDVEVDPEPFSPLALEGGASVPLEARIHVPLVYVPSGAGPSGPVLEAKSRLPRDRFEPLAEELERVGFRLKHDAADGRVATVVFQAPDTPAILWLAEPPLPRTFTWTALARDARLRSHAGTQPLPFEVGEAWARQPHRVTYRLVRTRAGPPPSWRARVEGDAIGPGLDVSFDTEVVLDEETAYCPVAVTFHATPGQALEARGTLVIESDDHPATFRIPYHVRVPPGLVAVALETPDDPTPLPAGPEDPWWLLLVEARNANVPSSVSVRWTVDPPEAADRLAVEMRSDDGLSIWPLGANGMLEPGVRYRVRPTPWPATETVPKATLSIVLDEQPGVEGVAEGSGRLRPREPALFVSDFPGSAYRVEDGEVVVGYPPLSLVLFPDGGSGDWLLAIQAIPPEVRTEGASTLAWRAEATGAGTWDLVPTGPWQGERAGIFEGRVDVERVHVSWPGGGAPGTLEIPVEVPARWGPAGWILVVLAGLALALGGWGLWQLRPAPVGGTLLYTMADREGAVGRLDLTGVGRRTTDVKADGSGRLGLSGAGPLILRIRPTRVGGLLVLEGDGGRQEHLLVDGLTLDAGSHRVRYVSGHAEDLRPAAPLPRQEDLLGPDFDLPTGRFDQLAAKRVQEEEGEAEAPPTRS